MPELPEVENLVLELEQALEKREISGVEIRNEDILRTPSFWIKRNLPGKKILQIQRRGKFIRIFLPEGFSLWFHLGMTGQLLLENAVGPLKPHTHFILSLGGTHQRLIFRDPRRFGRVALTPYRGERILKSVERLGPEPREWGREEFASEIRSRRGRIKNLLLNQRLMAGLGNIYADESLHRAGIHPFRAGERIARQRLVRLHSAICEVLEEACRHGGSTIDDYRHLDGQRGSFQAFHKVYGRSGEDCESCGTPIRKIKLSGRSSSFCPRCQR
ncbi:MAG: bifunctional DNA-formamidopyrimidine glycosylase/DNA-(apurinic or apyrimidinic site) lyase [Candidatus Omnitrophica bacterium]|nr:bifunctional DNA-formamidopyrimidine glycosylase/DNA-(apurinic or apyrimidinic site) lyase [Candidatus Omnitrophota bacterium]